MDWMWKGNTKKYELTEQFIKQNRRKAKQKAQAKA